MSQTTIEIDELPARFAELISLATSGIVVIVTEDSIPRARLMPLPTGQARVAGLHPGAIQTTADFDAPLPEAFWSGTS